MTRPLATIADAIAAGRSQWWLRGYRDGSHGDNREWLHATAGFAPHHQPSAWATAQYADGWRNAADLFKGRMTG